MKKTLLIVLLVVTVLQIGGPFLFTFSNWCNVIQYVSGFSETGTALLVIHFLHDYYTAHRIKLLELELHLLHLRREKEHVSN